mgnify:CR=1 FL=1
MKLLDCLKNEKLLCFAGGIFAATYGVKALKSDKTRKACVNGLATFFLAFLNFVCYI